MAPCKAYTVNTHTIACARVLTRATILCTLCSKRNKIYKNERCVINVCVNIMWQLGFRIPIPSKTFWPELFKLNFNVLPKRLIVQITTLFLDLNQLYYTYLYKNRMFTNKANGALLGL